MDNSQKQRLPNRLKRKLSLQEMREIKKTLRSHDLHTVCEEARCPNIGECFNRGTATFLIMGKICTRNCRFCNVATGTPKPLDQKEPDQIAQIVKDLGLKHVVITSVTRDDLEDGGAGHFAATIQAVRRENGAASIEVLVPDFKCSEGAIKIVIDASPDVFNHNIETVRRLTPSVRSKADYETSLKVLKTASKLNHKMKIKSGLMVGLGELKEEVEETLKDLRDVGCNIITIGQYLQPGKEKLEVKEFVEVEIFDEYKRYGESLGIEHVFSGPFVRSSYMADRFVNLTK